MKTRIRLISVTLFGLTMMLHPNLAIAHQPIADRVERSLSVGRVTEQRPAEMLPGWSHLSRHRDRIEVDFATGGLSAGVYTVWWNIVNFPGAKESGFSYVRAAGQVVGSDGVLRIKATLQKGAGGPGDPNHLTGPGLLKPLQANIIIVIRDHGPLGTNTVPLKAQLTTWGGGCNNTPPEFGPSGEFSCTNRQGAVHPAVKPGGIPQRQHTSRFKWLPGQG